MDSTLKCNFYNGIDGRYRESHVGWVSGHITAATQSVLI